MIDQDLIANIVTLQTEALDRVYLGNAPQDTAMPFIVVRRTGGEQPRTLGGISLFERSEFQINVIADNYADAYPAANTIRDAFKNYSGLLGSTSVKSARCTLFPVDQSEIDGDRVTRWVALSFLFMHS